MQIRERRLKGEDHLPTRCCIKAFDCLVTDVSRQGQLVICSMECMFVSPQPPLKFRLNCVKK